MVVAQVMVARVVGIEAAVLPPEVERLPLAEVQRKLEGLRPVVRLLPVGHKLALTVL